MKAQIGSWAMLAGVLAPVPALAALSVSACQPNLNLSSSDGALGAVADLCGALAETKINFNVEAGPAATPDDPLTPPSSAFTSLETVGLDTVWGDPSNARLDLSAGDKLGQVTNLMSPIADTGRQVNTNERNARLVLTLPPWNAFDITLTGTQNERTVSNLTVNAVSARTETLFDTASQGAEAGLKWTLPDGISLDAVSKLETINAAWRGQTGDAAFSYSGFEPSLTAMARTPGGGKLGLTFERGVQPIDSGMFSAFASVSSLAAGARFGPDREWRYRLKLDQPVVGGLNLGATLTAAQLESTTELGPLGAGLQAPLSISGGQRSEADVSFSAPLTLLGLPSFQFKGAGAWRASQIRDPFTGQLRALSGETPQTATLDLIQSLPAHRARWGLEGRFGGGQTVYQMSQITAVSVADSLGGFVEYNPGAFALRLQVDGLYGGDLAYTDTYYTGSRGDNVIDHVDHRSNNSQAVRLILKKSL